MLENLQFYQIQTLLTGFSNSVAQKTNNIKLARADPTKKTRRSG